MSDTADKSGRHYSRIVSRPSRALVVEIGIGIGRIGEGQSFVEIDRDVALRRPAGRFGRMRRCLGRIVRCGVQVEDYVVHHANGRYWSRWDDICVGKRLTRARSQIGVDWCLFLFLDDVSAAIDVHVGRTNCLS